jgi:hypothetical protein
MFVKVYNTMWSGLLYFLCWKHSVVYMVLLLFHNAPSVWVYSTCVLEWWFTGILKSANGILSAFTPILN